MQVPELSAGEVLPLSRRISVAPEAGKLFDRLEKFEPVVLDQEIVPPAGMPLEVWAIVVVESEDPTFEDANVADNTAASIAPEVFFS